MLQSFNEQKSGINTYKLVFKIENQTYKGVRTTHAKEWKFSKQSKGLRKWIARPMPSMQQCILQNWLNIIKLF